VLKKYTQKKQLNFLTTRL